MCTPCLCSRVMYVHVDCVDTLLIVIHVHVLLCFFSIALANETTNIVRSIANATTGNKAKHNILFPSSYHASAIMPEAITMIQA